jgi:hypothetical protein
MNAPIFVMGPPRSGTTLVARVLGRHSCIFMPGETDFFDDIYSRKEELGDPKNPEARQKIVERLATLYGRYNHLVDQQRIEKLFSVPALIDKLNTSGRSYRDILTSFMNVQMRSEEKTRWGNNVPKDIFNIKEILSFYPDAKVLICVRDVRDFLLSYKNFWKVGSSEEHADRKKMLYHPILTSLLWKASIKQITACASLVPTENLMIMRYESLVENPLELVQAICKFVGADFESEMLELDWHNSPFQVQSGGIFSSSVGRWREELEKEETYLAQKIARKELELLRYRIEQIEASPFKLAWIFATFPYALWKALYANKAHRGHFIPYIIKRITSLISQYRA